MAWEKVNKSFTDSSQSSTSKTTQSSTTQKVLNEDLLAKILSGLTAQMTDAEIRSYAESLLAPTLNAELEAAQNNYETTRLSGEQQISNLASSLARSIQEQQSAYKQSAADVETAALARGMGRSSYTLQSLANQGKALAQATQMLTEDTARQQSQIQQQIGLAAQQASRATGRLNTDYAKQLAAKVQELRQNQQNAYNQNYMTAVSAALGSQTTGTSNTSGTGKSSSISGQYESKDKPSGEKKASTASTTGTFTTK